MPPPCGATSTTGLFLLHRMISYAARGSARFNSSKLLYLSGIASRSSNMQPSTESPEPFLALGVVRENLVDLIPERAGVVAVMEMTQLVDDDVIDDGWRRHHALPMEAKPSRGRARSPSMPEFLDSDPAR